MPAVSTLPRVQSIGTAVLINFWADVQLADGSTATYRIQAEDLLALVAAKAGGVSFPTLDAAGHLVLNGQACLAVNADGELICSSAIPETNNGFVPVPGSNVIYTDGGVLRRA